MMVIVNKMRHLMLVGIVILFGCLPMQSQPEYSAVRNANELIDRGVVYMRQGDFDRAEAAFKVSLENAPQAAAMDGLGCVAFLRGQIKLAEELFLKAYKMDEKYDHALGNLALVMEVKGEIANANDLFERAIKSEPNDPRVRNNYAIFLLANKRAGVNKVSEELRKAESLAPHPLIAENIDVVQERYN